MQTLFAAIKPPPDILDKVVPLQKGIEGASWSPRDNLHITLGYFGLVADEFAEILDYELALRPGIGFDVRLEGANIFGGSRPRTLWFGVEANPALAALHQHVRRAARRSKIDMETRNFTPHLSLAYMRGGVALGDLSRYLRRHLGYKSKPFLIDQFALYSSNTQKSGPNLYIKEANYPLLGP